MTTMQRLRSQHLTALINGDDFITELTATMMLKLKTQKSPTGRQPDQAHDELFDALIVTRRRGDCDEVLS